MAPNDEIVFDSPPFIRIYKSGRVERFTANEVTPPSVHPVTGVSSKDVLISPETGVAARLYLPTATPPNKELPLLVYFHGGGFCVGSAFNSFSHDFLNSLVARANVLAVSVDYRLAPEHPVPAAFDDSWAALQWVASHAGSTGAAGSWLAEHADFRRVFLAGESAGATIAHQMAMRAGYETLDCGVKIKGVVLIHPYFLGTKGMESDMNDEEMSEKMKVMWRVVCPSAAAGVDDPWINPLAGDAPRLSGLGCGRVMVCVAEKDVLRDRGRAYCEVLRRSGWKGEVEMWETEGEGHVFHIADGKSDKALALEEVISSFINLD